MYKIHFVPPALAWFKHPKPDPRFYHPSQQTPDLIGLWDPAIKRPTTDRHFTPSTPSSEDIRERFLTCPPSVCSDPALKALLESKPLTRSVSGKKQLALPGRMFNKTHVNFKETPLFAITQHQSKLALGNTAAMAQLCSGMQDFLSWLVDNWDFAYLVINGWLLRESGQTFWGLFLGLLLGTGADCLGRVETCCS